jgi:hypothetical protein
MSLPVTEARGQVSQPFAAAAPGPARHGHRSSDGRNAHGHNGRGQNARGQNGRSKDGRGQGGRGQNGPGQNGSGPNANGDHAHSQNAGGKDAHGRGKKRRPQRRDAAPGGQDSRRDRPAADHAEGIGSVAFLARQAQGRREENPRASRWPSEAKGS